jgi:hypothetical protein
MWEWQCVTDTSAEILRKKEDNLDVFSNNQEIFLDIGMVTDYK